jgi:hypothetical protein
MFFSEEKNQKTLIPSPASRWRPRPQNSGAARMKSLLVLFFRKEHSFFYRNIIVHASNSTRVPILAAAQHRIIRLRAALTTA